MRRVNHCRMLAAGLMAVVGGAMTLLPQQTAITTVPTANAIELMASPDRTSWGRRNNTNKTIKTIKSSAPRYEAIDLGVPEGGHSVEPSAASPNGRYVVGYVSTRTILRAFVWHDGVFQYLGTQQSVAR